MKIDTDTLKKQVILHLPYLLFLLVFAKLGQAVRLAPGADASQKMLGLSEGFTYALSSFAVPRLNSFPTSIKTVPFGSVTT